MNIDNSRRSTNIEDYRGQDFAPAIEAEQQALMQRQRDVFHIKIVAALVAGYVLYNWWMGR